MAVRFVLQTSGVISDALDFLKLGRESRLLSVFITVGILGNILSMVASTWITKKFCKIQLFRWSQLVTFALSVIMYLAVKPGDVARPWSCTSSSTSSLTCRGRCSGPSSRRRWITARSRAASGWPAWRSAAFPSPEDGHEPGRRNGRLAARPISNTKRTWCRAPFTLKGIALCSRSFPACFHLVMGLLMYRYRHHRQILQRNDAGAGGQRWPEREKPQRSPGRLSHSCQTPGIRNHEDNPASDSAAR